MAIRPHLSLIAAAALFGCAPSTELEDRSHVTVSDSSGVTIVEYSGPLSPQFLVLGEHLGLPALDPPVGGLGRAALLPDDRVAFSDMQAANVRVVGDGVQLQIGQRGEGPGEFGLVTTLSPVRSGLSTFDQRLQRLQIFDATSGSLISSRNVSDLTESFVSSGEVTDYGAIVLRGAVSQSRTDGYARGTYQFSLVRPTDSVPIEITRTPSRGVVSVDRGEGRIAMRTPPLVREGFHTLLPGRLVVGEGEVSELRAYSLSDGSLSHVVRFNVLERALDEALIAEEVRARVATVPEESRAAAATTYRDSFIQDSLQSMVGLIGDPESAHLWIQAPRVGAKPERWFRLDLSGSPIHAIDLPEGVRLLDVRGSRFLGAITDALGIDELVYLEPRVGG